MTVTCDYCGRRGAYPSEVESRPAADGSPRWACVDRRACDEREEQQVVAAEIEEAREAP